MVESTTKSRNEDNNRPPYLYIIMMALFAVCGIWLLIAGFYLPPRGVIDNSVLIAFGECGVFVSTMMWIRYNKDFRRRKR